MNDKILQVKKDMIELINQKGLTRAERFYLLKQRSNQLNENERKILLKECRRDYESYNRISEIKELFSFFLAGITLMFSLVGIYFQNLIMNYIQFNNLLSIIIAVIIVIIIGFSSIGSWKSKRMNITRYLIDILEDI